MNSQAIVQPYLNFDGKCEEALEFYRRALGAQVNFQMRYQDSPEPPPPGCPPPDPNKIMHAQVQIGQTVIMASDGRGTGHPEIRGHLAVAHRANRGGGGTRFQRPWRRAARFKCRWPRRSFRALRHGDRPLRPDVDGAGRPWESGGRSQAVKLKMEDGCCRNAGHRPGSMAAQFETSRGGCPALQSPGISERKI